MDLQSVCRRNWKSISAIAIGIVLVAAASLPVPPKPSRLFTDAEKVSLAGEIADTRKALGESLAHDEELLVTIISLQFGIVAFAATMIFGKDFPTEGPRELFGILLLLTIILCVVYLHLYKGYIGSYVYALKLEENLPSGLRSYQEIYRRLENDSLNPLRHLVSLDTTFFFASFLPVYVVIITAIGFGRKLRISRDTMLAVSVLVSAWSVAYLLPVFHAIFALEKAP
jgi:hypothetical protein